MYDGNIVNVVFFWKLSFLLKFMWFHNYHIQW